MKDDLTAVGFFIGRFRRLWPPMAAGSLIGAATLLGTLATSFITAVMIPAILLVPIATKLGTFPLNGIRWLKPRDTRPAKPFDHDLCLAVAGKSPAHLHARSKVPEACGPLSDTLSSPVTETVTAAAIEGEAAAASECSVPELRKKLPARGRPIFR